MHNLDNLIKRAYKKLKSSVYFDPVNLINQEKNLCQVNYNLNVRSFLSIRWLKLKNFG